MAEFIIPSKTGYGAIELKRSYRKYLLRGFVISMILHFLALDAYLAYMAFMPKEQPAKVIRLTKYDESFDRIIKLAPPPSQPTITYEGDPSAKISDLESVPEMVESMIASAANPAAPQRMNLAAELNDLDIGNPTLAQPALASRGAHGSNSSGGVAPGAAGVRGTPIAARDPMPGSLANGLDADLSYGAEDLGTRLPTSGRGGRGAGGSGGGKGTGIQVGTSGATDYGSGQGGGGLGNGNGVGDAGLGAPGRDGSGRGRGSAGSVKVDLRGLTDFGDNYRNFTPIYRNLVEWMRRHPADLPEIVDRFMGFQPGNQTARVTFNIGGRPFEMLLLCVESSYEVRVVLLEGGELTYLIDEGFRKQSNYLRTGSLIRRPDGEIMSFSSVMREASDRRTQEFYQIFLSWWNTVKHEVGG